MTKKTWSRELAFVMLVFCGVLAYQEKTPELEILIWPATVFALPAFGFKQELVKDMVKREGK